MERNKNRAKTIKYILVFLIAVFVGYVFFNFQARESKKINETEYEEYELAGTTTEEQVGIRLIPHKNSVYHGAFAGFSSEEDTVTKEHIEAFRELTGKNIVWGYFSNNWFNGIQYPEQQIEELNKNGIIPFVRLMPRSKFQTGGQDPIYTLDKIIQGEFDEELRVWARSARDSNIPLLVEFGTEMNGNWFTWSGASNGAGATEGYGDPSIPDGPERFKDAYRHIINLFNGEKSYNITWFFHINLLSKPNEDWNSPRQYYPGDEYIDWIGVSAYGAQFNNDPWISFTDLMDKHFPEIINISPDKPIAILEFGVIERQGKDKGEWINNALQSIIDGRYPNIYAVSYWHSKWTNSDGTISDMKIDSSESSLLSYREIIKNPLFVTNAIFSQQYQSHQFYSY